MEKRVTSIKVTFRCKNEDKPKLKGSSCIVHISLGQEYHEGEKFLATMDLINETFSSCDLMLCDTLQRHTLMIKDKKMNEEDAYRKSRELGDEWLKRNINAYKYLKIPLKIYRWDDWINHERYTFCKKQIIDLYKNDFDYHQCIENTIENFLKRQVQIKKGTKEYQNATSLSRGYLLEECPVLIPLWAETNKKFVIYPRARTPAMAATYDHFINEKNILKEVALKFNHRVKPKELSFSYFVPEGDKKTEAFA